MLFLFYFVSEYSRDIVSFIVGHALATKWQWPGVPHPFLEVLNTCPSSKRCHERNSVRYPEIMLIEENPGPILLFLALPTQECIRRERGVWGPYAEADYWENLEKILPFYSKLFYKETLISFIKFYCKM